MDTLKQIGIKRNQDTLQIELLIARLYLVGVIVSFLIVAIGVGALMITGQTGYSQSRFDDLNSMLTFRATPAFPNSLGDVFYGVAAFKPFAIISLGLLVLIAIPVVRVAVTVIIFARQRDWLYALITIFVLAMLLLSFAIGEVGG
ncbi:MAG: DUF1634 domain-containing protein [Chloroflexi bacterium]|nr:DUF1634 domain-containing protein [Chloroflexota bacterium]